MGSVTDRSGWPVVSVAVHAPTDLEVLADELAEILAREEPFALNVVAPGNIETLQRMLWAAPQARRRLRRQRLRLAAWCEAAAHVLTPAARGSMLPSTLRQAELIWGCATIAADSEDEADNWLRARLQSRLEPARRTLRTTPDQAVPLVAPAV